MNQKLHPFWAVPIPELFEDLQTAAEGLSEDESERGFEHYGANLLKPKKRTDVLALLLAQFKSPIILILLFAAGVSLFLQDSADALIILIIVLVSGLLGSWQERGAVNADLSFNAHGQTFWIYTPVSFFPSFCWGDCGILYFRC